MNNENLEYYDLLGVGIGPFNMSLAALLSPIGKIKSLFFEKNANFKWHGGMLLPEAYLQVSFLKDLVTLVDPTNPYSFLNFLVNKKRIYPFIITQNNYVHRSEFNEYLEWVSQNLSNLCFSEEIHEIKFINKKFVLSTNKRDICGSNIVLGTGIKPKLPDWAKGKEGPLLYHNHDYMHHKHDWHEKHVVIVGGGQSGAEIVQNILSNSSNIPSELYWISRRKQFAPLDDSPFVNEFFTPPHVENFYTLPINLKNEKLEEQKLASDGISLSLLQSIYQRIYKLKLIDKCNINIHLYPDHDVENIMINQHGFNLTSKNLILEINKIIRADIVILCTGYQSDIPKLLDPFLNDMKLQSNPKINADYSIAWEGSRENKIYIQNGSKENHGVSDPNLSLAAWRSAVIVNSLLNEDFYNVKEAVTLFDWQKLYSETNTL